MGLTIPAGPCIPSGSARRPPPSSSPLVSPWRAGRGLTDSRPGSRRCHRASRSARRVPDSRSITRAAWSAARITSPVSIRSDDSQNQPQLAYIAEAPALRAHDVEETAPDDLVGVAAEPLPGERGPIDRPDDDVDVGVAGRPRVGRAGQGPGDLLGLRVDAFGEPVQRGAQRRFPAAIRDAATGIAPAGDAVVAAPRGALDHGRRSGTSGRPRGPRRPGRHVVAQVGLADQASQEHVPERLVVSVQLAVRGDDRERRGFAIARLARVEPRADPLPREPVGIPGRVDIERDRVERPAS